MKKIAKKDCIYYIRSYGPVGEYILADERNKRKFIDIVTFVQEEKTFAIYGYCIMDNHIHLIINIKLDSLSDIMDEIICRYNAFYRERNGRHCQALDKIYNKKLVNDREELLYYCRLIHQEPVRYGFVHKAEHYLWSSYRFFYQEEKGSPVVSEHILSMLDYNREEAIKKFSEYHHEFSDYII